MNIGFIGAGQMAQALAAGIASQLSNRENEPKVEFWINDPSSQARDSFRRRVGQTAKVHELESNGDVVTNANLVFLAVKPQCVETALAEVGSSVDLSSTTFVSIVAGIPISRIVSMLGCKRVVRVMPNTPCLIGKGTCGVVASPDVIDAQLDEILRLLQSVGTTVQVSEFQMDAVTGLSGSGPAYVFTFIEALAEGGVSNGLPPDVAHFLALETVIGAGELVRQSGEDIPVLRDRVSSPGGTTIAGLAALDGKGFRETVISAVTAATERSRVLRDE